MSGSPCVTTSEKLLIAKFGARKRKVKTFSPHWKTMGEREGESRKQPIIWMTASFLLCREGGHQCNEKNTEQVKLEGAKLRTQKRKRPNPYSKRESWVVSRAKAQSCLFLFKKKKGNKSPPGHGSSAGDLVKVSPWLLQGLLVYKHLLPANLEGIFWPFTENLTMYFRPKGLLSIPLV